MSQVAFIQVDPLSSQATLISGTLEQSLGQECRSATKEPSNEEGSITCPSLIHANRLSEKFQEFSMPSFPLRTECAARRSSVFRSLQPPMLGAANDVQQEKRWNQNWNYIGGSVYCAPLDRS